jgi:transcriptional regulator with AAA-type ATPase domain/tetratricopeptide (TPR) repeat protein
MPGMKVLADLLGDSPGIRAVRETVARVLARQQDVRRLPSILIEGETGAGKGLLARMIHRAGPRPEGPFIDVNCAAIPDTLLEAEMFGFERGAFTDARRSKPGLFQAAHRGTIFLDEVGLLPEALQAKLLKVLEERTVRRLGATRDEPVDVWVLTATNEDLRHSMRERRFREDLYHRLAVLTVTLPPLRERGDDIMTLAEHFLERTCAEYGIARKALTAGAGVALRGHLWPGNVRELSNVIERAVLLAPGDELTAAELGLQAPPAAALAPAPRTESPVSLDDAMREHLVEVLGQTSWNISRTAALLGISRNTLRARMDRYGLREREARSAGRARPAAPAPAGLSAAPPPPAVSAAAPVAAPPSLAPPPPSGRRWERRRVALLRAALVPPATPDATLETARALEIIVDKVETFGGKVEGIGPIGVMVSFGLAALGDAAERAGHTALAIVKAVDRARRDEQSEVAVKVGLHAAPMLVGLASGSAALDMDESRDLWPLLDELIERAPRDGVVVTAAAASLLRRRFEVAPGPVLIDQTPTYLLLGRERTGFGLGGHRAEFVGRRQEIELLQSRLEVAATGRGQVVGIVGDAGIGKSRLLFEFRQSARSGSTTFLLGHCHAWGAAAPYLPVLAILRSACGVADTDSAEDVVVKIDAAVRAHGMRADERDVLLQLLGTGPQAEPGPEQDPEVFKTRALEAVRQLMIRRSRQGAVVILVEDAHWMDRASEGYFTSLVDAMAGVPIMLVCTYRPGYRPPWMDKSFTTQMGLQPLGSAEGRTLARAALGAQSLDGPLLDTVLAKAEGNPFFVEELARSLREQGDRGPLAVPDTIEDVLRSRVDRLQLEDQRLLQRAAVIGREVPVSLLEAIEGPTDGLRAGLLRVQSAEFLYEVPRGPESEFLFKHTLTHEVIYASLEPSARRTLHARLVEIIERSHAGRLGDVTDRLARHAYQGGLWAQAVRYLREAGTHAAARGAHREAVADLEQALTALAQQPAPEAVQAIDLRFDLRTSLLPLGEHERIFAVLREAETLAEAAGDRARLGRVCTYLTNSLFISGDQVRGLDYGRRALAIADELGDAPLQAEARLRLGQVHHALGEYPQAVAMLSGPVEGMREDVVHARFGLPIVFSVGCRVWLVRALGELGEFEAGRQRGEEAVRIAEAAGHTYSLAVAYWSIGNLRLRQGELDLAIVLLERGEELARTWGIRVWITRFEAALGLARARASRRSDAVALLERAVAQNLTVPDRAPIVTALAEACWRAGRMPEARAHAEHALDLARACGDRGTEAWVHHLRGAIAADTEPVVAAASLERALALATELRMRPLIAQAHLGLGRLAGRTTAPGHFISARTLFSEMAMHRAADETTAALDRLG